MLKYNTCKTICLFYLNRSGKYTNIATNSNAEDIKDSQPSTSHTGKSILNCSEPPNSNEMSQVKKIYLNL